VTIWVDSREKARAIKLILRDFDAAGIQYITNKLPVGDYMSMDNSRLVIDRKQNLLEICSNVVQDHDRFKRELILAKNLGQKVIILCEHGGNIKCLDDVIGWENPRLSVSPLAVSGERLYRILCQIKKTYGIEILFCEKKETGSKIIELLGG
jgi:ERCC4-type nuclease